MIGAQQDPHGVLEMVKDYGEPFIRIVAMPKDTNSAGNIFGGWIMSQIDLAGGSAARQVAPERVVTVSMKEVLFTSPVYVGDQVCYYARIKDVGKTSINVQIEVIALRLNELGFRQPHHVASAHGIYVSVTKTGEKKLISEELKRLHGF